MSDVQNDEQSDSEEFLLESDDDDDDEQGNLTTVNRMGIPPLMRSILLFLIFGRFCSMFQMQVIIHYLHCVYSLHAFILYIPKELLMHLLKILVKNLQKFCKCVAII